MPEDALLRTVGSHADLLDLTHGDPFVRWGVPDPFEGAVLAGPGAVAVERWGRRRHSMWLIPLPTAPCPADALTQVLTGLREAGHVHQLGLRGLSVPQPYAEVLAAQFDLAGGGEWDWMWTTTVPEPDPVQAQLLVLDDTADAEELAAFSQRHSPTGEGEAGTGLTALWLGLRGPDGRLQAAGGMQYLASGYPHLAGIVVREDLRGRGLGRAVTAELTRQAIAEHQVCTLGMYTDNGAARAVYHRLGYRTAYAWHSRSLA